MAYKKLWIALTLVLVISFAVLGGVGVKVLTNAPPIPSDVISTDGQVLLNTTPVHSHTALFGVYGMLGLGLMLFCLRALRPGKAWKNGVLSFSFWAINIGLALMVLISMLPIGLMQAWASVEYGTWYARSAEFLHSGGMNQLRWLRMIGDSIFALGALALGWFVLGLVTGHSYGQQAYVGEGEWEVRPQRTGTRG